MALFTKANRRKAKLRMAITGPSGAGKTLGALYIAYGITNDWGKVALLDTEHERALFYEERPDLDIGQFLWAALEPPYSPERYKAYIADAAQAVGPDGVIIVDSFSHAWKNEGGILDYQEKVAARPGKNSYTAWSEASTEQNALVNAILSTEAHVITTLRVKTEYVMTENDRGKMVPVKVGLAPVQRNDVEYEFDIVLNIDREHVARASKDVTFLDKYGAVITPELGRNLGAWLAEGKEPPRCEVCHKVIMPTKKKTVEELIEGTKERSGQVMCVTCFNIWYKEHGTETVSNSAD